MIEQLETQGTQYGSHNVGHGRRSIVIQQKYPFGRLPSTLIVDSHLQLV